MNVNLKIKSSLLRAYFKARKKKYQRNKSDKSEKV